MPDDQRSHWNRIGKDAAEILNVHTEVARRQSPVGSAVDAVGRFMAHPVLFVLIFVAHAGWVVLNLPLMPWEPWDPYPFMFLATVASVEAPFIALLVLMYQRRMQRIADLREEITLQVTLHVERKTSMALRVLDDLEDHLGIDEKQDGLDRMKQDLDPKRLLDEVGRDLRESEGSEDDVTSQK